MSRRRPENFTHVDYTQLREVRDGFTESQFQSPAACPVPWKAIALALLLCVAGVIMLVVGSMTIAGVIDTKYQDRMWPMIILGALMFIPGAYHVRIAYYAYQQLPGYSFQDIPEFD